MSFLVTAMALGSLVAINPLARPTVGVAVADGAPTSLGGSYVSMSATRIVDSRTSNGLAGPLIPGKTATVQVAGRGGLPKSGLVAVNMRITVVAGGSAGFLQISPSVTPAAGAASMTFAKALPATQNLIVNIDGTGAVHLLSSQSAQVIIDVAGWFTTASTASTSNGLFHPLPGPVLVADPGTKDGSWPYRVGQVDSIALSHPPIVPLGVSAVSVSILAKQDGPGAMLMVYPHGTIRPALPVMWTQTNQVVSTHVILPVSPTGVVDLSPTGGAGSVLFVINGWFSGQSQIAEDGGGYYVPTADTRLLDTRLRIGPTASWQVDMLETDVIPGINKVPGERAIAAVAVSIVVAPSAQGGEAVTAGDSPTQLAELGWPAGATFSNMALPRLSTMGTVDLTSSVPVNMVFDRTGWFVGRDLTVTSLAGSTAIASSGQTGIAYSQQLDAAGGSPAYTWSVVGATLPAGLTLDPHGTVSGTPTRAGEMIGKYRVTDSQGFYADAFIYLVIGVGPGMAAGSLVGWGADGSGAIGDGGVNLAQTGENGATVPTQSLMTDVVAGAGGYDGTYVLRADGTVWSFGSNYFDALGSGNDVSASGTPLRVGKLSHVIAVAASFATGYALTDTGQVWAWGDGRYGNLGNGQVNVLAPSPVLVQGLTGVVSISAGDHTAMALRSDGTVWTWGAGGDGQLGNGTFGDTAVPVQVTGLSGVKAIDGAWDMYALLNDGTVWAWGTGAVGELGDGLTDRSAIPVRVHALNHVVAISGSRDDGYAVRADGSIWAWGDNTSGELGDGGFRKPALVPIPVSGASGCNAVQIAAEDSTVLVRCTSGAVWAWGAGEAGETGLYGGRSVPGAQFAVPQPNPLLQNVSVVFAGFSNGYAVIG